MNGYSRVSEQASYVGTLPDDSDRVQCNLLVQRAMHLIEKVRCAAHNITSISENLCRQRILTGLILKCRLFSRSLYVFQISSRLMRIICRVGLQHLNICMEIMGQFSDYHGAADYASLVLEAARL